MIPKLAATPNNGHFVQMSFTQRFCKRLFDFTAALAGIALLWPIILIGWFASSVSTRSNGFFVQHRVGKDGKLFPMLKLRSMISLEGYASCVTTDNDIRITGIGRLLRKYKMDELPQLLNVLVGQMSLVGPRPDIPGYADRLTGENRSILALRPGITGPASIAFRDEERLLVGVDDPESYSDQVLWPAKVKINMQYLREYSFMKDIRYIWQTVSGGGELVYSDHRELNGSGSSVVSESSPDSVG